MAFGGLSSSASFDGGADGGLAEDLGTPCEAATAGTGTSRDDLHQRAKDSQQIFGGARERERPIFYIRRTAVKYHLDTWREQIHARLNGLETGLIRGNVGRHTGDD